MQAYWLVVRVLLTPPAEAAASQKWKIIYLQVLMTPFGGLRRKASCGLTEQKLYFPQYLYLRLTAWFSVRSPYDYPEQVTHKSCPFGYRDTHSRRLRLYRNPHELKVHEGRSAHRLNHHRCQLV